MWIGIKYCMVISPFLWVKIFYSCLADVDAERKPICDWCIVVGAWLSGLPHFPYQNCSFLMLSVGHEEDSDYCVYISCPFGMGLHRVILESTSPWCQGILNFKTLACQILEIQSSGFLNVKLVNHTLNYFIPGQLIPLCDFCLYLLDIHSETALRYDAGSLAK